MKSLVSLVLASIVALWAAPAIAQDSQSPLASNFLYNYYTQPGTSLVQAGMYPAPHPVPTNVGWAQYTYQPLMPHEHMYEHTRRYFQYYGDGCNGACDSCCPYGLNKTTVVWQNGASHVGPSPFSWAFAQRWHYNHAARRYCLDNPRVGAGAACGGACR